MAPAFANMLSFNKFAETPERGRLLQLHQPPELSYNLIIITILKNKIFIIVIIKRRFRVPSQ